MQRTVGTDAKILKRLDSGTGPVLGIRDQSMRTERATQQGASQLIEQDLALGDITGRDEGMQADACLTTVYEVVVLVAKDSATILHLHRCRIRVCAADLAARDALV
jgi:hypothetical protein